KKASGLEAELEALSKKEETDTLKAEMVAKKKELADLKERLETERKSIAMARICVLGLPQNNKPFEKAALLFLRDPSLPVLMDAHHASIRKQNYEIQHSALKAQRERLDVPFSFAASALKNAKITATPRDAYFQVFGGKELFDLAMARN